MRRRLILFALFIIFFTTTHAQYAGWMLGTWKSTGVTGSVTQTIQITDVTRESFTGTKTSERNDGSHGKITISISGAVRGVGLYVTNGEVLQKDGPGNGQWYDCSACAETDKMVIHHDSLILISSIADCDKRCDGETSFYRLLTEYDSATQRHLVDRFGKPPDIIGFRPFQPHQDDTVASQHDEQRSLKDSLKNVVATLEQTRRRTEDSLRNVQAGKRNQEIADSINLAKQKKQQHIKDSLDNVARVRQQQINDSTLLAQHKKREQEIADSLNLVKQRDQQRIKDSLDNVARLEQIRRRTEDSLRNVQIKKRQQEVADSLNLVHQREQQRINDSLQNVAAANLQKQRTADSLRNVQAIKRQQEITDSLAAVRKQQYDDSLQKAALAKAVPPTPAADKALTSRTSILLETYHITSPDILIELFDNGEIDGDRVSVYHNNQIIVSNQTLGIKAITVKVHADAANREHEFVMVAENLGSIPPNSALMRITAGKQSYKLAVKTDMKTNARIVFYYDGN